MNFFNGAKVDTEGGATKIVLDGIGQVQVPPLYEGQARDAAGKNLTFGIRPEHLSDASLLPQGSDGGSIIQGTVEVVEHLGSELQVYVDTGGKATVTRLDPRSQAHVGGTIPLHVDTDQIHLFDSDTKVAFF